MDTQQAYADRLEAQMRVADARLDQMEAQARARNAKAEMDEVSGLRARRDKIQQLVAAAKKEVGDDWQAFQSRVQANWADSAGTWPSGTTGSTPGTTHASGGSLPISTKPRARFGNRRATTPQPEPMRASTWPERSRS
jgi:hypothetical protein